MPKGQRPITTYNVFETPSLAGGAKSVAAGESATSVAINLREVAQEGLFSLQYVVTGTGTAKIEYLVGEYAADTFVEPSGAADIATGLTSSSGTSGRDVITFEPEMAPFIKLKVTETGSSNAVVVTLKLNIQ